MTLRIEFHMLQSFMSPPIRDHYKIRVKDGESECVDVLEMDDVKISNDRFDFIQVDLSEKAMRSLDNCVKRLRGKT